MTKSKMRIYKGRGYSDHAVDLYMTVDMEDVAGLWIKTPHEDIRLQADDVVITLLPRILEHIETGLQK